jgi:hypothetical protein
MVTTVQKMQVVSSGAWPVPAGVEGVWITMIGGGGSGGSSYQSGGGFGGAGGSSGELCVRFPVKVTPGGSMTVVIGNGGPVNNQTFEWTGLSGLPTSFGSFSVDGGATGRGGGPGGVTVISSLGRSESPFHYGGSNRSAGGANGGFPGTQDWGYTGATAPGYPGGPGGQPNAGYTGLYGSGGGGGASTIFGIGGQGGVGGGGGGSGHGPTGDTGGNPPSTNGHVPPVGSYGAGGGGAGGSPAGYSGKTVWGGPGYQGICIVEWYEEVP